MPKPAVIKIHYNSPVILTFSLIAVGIQLLNTLLPGVTEALFMVRPEMSIWNPLDYFRLVSHVLGHGSWQHLLGNITYVLLLGPILEEKYGNVAMLLMIVFTALITGLLNVLFFATALLGASGIVFMLIILASIVDVRAGEIPLTFVLVAGIFIGTELWNAFSPDQISQMAHIVGGSFGALFGFMLSHQLPRPGAPKSRKKNVTP
jgi:membrane associated rhomboid family serine protease